MVRTPIELLLFYVNVCDVKICNIKLFYAVLHVTGAFEISHGVRELELAKVLVRLLHYSIKYNYIFSAHFQDPGEE